MGTVDTIMAGKPMLTNRLTTFLLKVTLPSQALDTTHIHRVAGLTGARTAVVTTRPCRALPETISAVGVIGGDQVPMAGEVSLVHHGMLLLEAFPECRRHVIGVVDRQG
jgi:magnesium chelatase family protein